MGINNLELSPELIAALYPETLVAGSEPVPVKSNHHTPQAAPEPAYTFTGKNLRSICFLVRSPEDEILPAEQLVFLNKILAACKINLDDIALINTCRDPVTLAGLKKQFRPRIIFLWGSPQTDIAETNGLPDMNVCSLDDFLVVPVLLAHSMSSEDARALELKQKLWTMLKKLFNL